MGHIERYLATEIIGPFLVALLFLYALLFMMQLMRGIDVLFGAGVELADLGRIALYQAPHFLVMAMPVSLLFAVMLAAGRLAEDRETMALAASGVSPARLIVAPLAIGLVVALCGVLLAAGPDPRGLATLQAHINELIKKNMAGEVRPGVFYDALSNMTLYTEKVDERTGAYTHVMLSDERDAEASLFVLSQRGHVDPEAPGGVLPLVLQDGEIHRGAADERGHDYAVLTFEEAEVNVGVERSLEQKNRFGRAREELTPQELMEAAARAREEGKVAQANQFEVVRHRRVADSLASLIFALFAVPLATGRRGASRALGAMATLAAYVGYYILARSGEIAAEKGQLSPFVAAHGANFVFFLLGLWLLWASCRGERRT